MSPWVIVTQEFSERELPKATCVTFNTCHSRVFCSYTLVIKWATTALSDIVASGTSFSVEQIGTLVAGKMYCSFGQDL